jgi:hypothetical protein
MWRWIFIVLFQGNEGYGAIQIQHKDLDGFVISLKHMVVNFEHKVSRYRVSSVDNFSLMMFSLHFVQFKSQEAHFGINYFIE